MAVYKQRRKDVKYYVEEAMRKLNFQTNSNYVNEMGENECTVIHSDYDSNIDTQESYWDTVWLKIMFNVADNGEVPYTISRVKKFVTNYVEESGAPNCTSFYFGPCPSTVLGTMTKIEMNCRYSFEVDWEEE